MVVALPLIQQVTNASDFALSATSAQSIVSTLMLGAVIGSLVGGVVADWVGRKPANLITAALFLSGSLFMTFAGSLQTMLVGRFVAGLAVGSSGPCVSTYVAEIAQPKTRGALVTISEKYRTKEASAVLKRLLYSEEASQEIIRAHLDIGTFHESFIHAMSELVTDGLTRKRVLFCVTIAFCHILTAANAMLYYSSYILDGLQMENAHQVSSLSKEIWVGIAKLAGVCSAVAVVDRVGRRHLLIIGTSLMLICHFIFAVCFWTLSSTHSETVQTIGEWNLYVFIFAWNLSWAPLMWVVCSEILPDEFRSIGMGLTFGTFWLGSALVNQTLLSVFHAFGTGNAFLLYSALTATSLGFVYFKVPETTGLTFEQIAMLFNEQTANAPLVNALEDGGLSTAQQQLEELECMLSMFPNSDELKVDEAAESALEEFVAESNRTDKLSRPASQIHYTLYYKDLAFGRDVPSLTLACPLGYPKADPMLFESTYKAQQPLPKKRQRP
ncbi:Major Facilitator Superfamily (MFS) [Phytophthora infestans T30-4]|uniref:Hexose transporter 1 n=1 Tax=Phytophthora infestans (strain T30-4) TaxID=403677 RepID=D0MYL2_PHYIT|nr:Major Facilitator Superfamily (MFS) [Phytophthora infestans T30-4]EEY66260.1 Major Facilitator Superfamily (MFS) [Phytophthora infestans T30-4]|eukprot:XP_002906859.1 Major Facilitator Superfamily (MFS) [Phytophthora infestans T30-4]